MDLEDLAEDITEGDPPVSIDISVGNVSAKFPVSEITSVVISSVREVCPTAISHMEAHRLSSILTQNIKKMAAGNKQPKSFKSNTRNSRIKATLPDMLHEIQTNYQVPSIIDQYPINLRDLNMERKLSSNFQNAFAALKATGDGNCFYNSLSLAIFKSEKFHKEIKMLVLQEFQQYQKEIKQLCTETHMDYAGLKNRLETEFSYSNNDVIFIASQAFSRKINIFTPSSVNVHDADPAKSKNLPAINIFYQGRPTHHFFPLIEKLEGSSASLQMKTTNMFKNIASRYKYVSTRKNAKHQKQSVATSELASNSIIIEINDDDISNATSTQNINCNLRRSTRIRRNRKIFSPEPNEKSSQNVSIQCVQCFRYFNRKEEGLFVNAQGSTKTFICKDCLPLQNSVIEDPAEKTDTTKNEPNFKKPKKSNLNLSGVDINGKTLNDENVSIKAENDIDENCHFEHEQTKRRPHLSKIETAELLGISTETIQNYKIPTKFTISIAAAVMNKIYSFKAKRFIGNEWAAALSEQIGKITPCSFIARSSPDYLVRTFSKMRGKCGGDCDVKFVVTGKRFPTRGMRYELQVTTTGSVNVHQDIPTGRPIRGKRVRSAMAKRLKGVSAEKLHLQLLQKTANSPIKLLHNNMPHRSSGSLRKLKSEDKLKNRTSFDPVEDLRNTAARLRGIQNTNDKVSGFVHAIDDDPDINFYLYDNTSIGLHSRLSKKFSSTIFLDATGSLVQPFKGKKVLNFLIVAEAGSGQFYNVAEMATSDLTRHAVVKFLKQIRRRVADFGNSDDKFCDVAVCDFSLPIIHGYIEGLCDCQIRDYFHHCWKVMTDPGYASSRPVIFICSAHTIRAFQRNLKSKIANVKNPKKVQNMALHSIAKLMQCLSLEEFEEVCKAIIKIFIRERLPENERKETCRFLCAKNILPNQTEEFFNSNMENFDLTSTKEEKKTLRESSEFFHIFRCMIAEETEVECVEEDPLNEYRCSTVTDVLLKSYIPFFPFWSCYMVVKLKDKSFIGKTNAAVEAQFKIKKSLLETCKSDTYSIYVEKAGIHFAKNIEKVLQFSRKAKYARAKKTTKSPPSNGKNASLVSQQSRGGKRRKRKRSPSQDDSFSKVYEEWNKSKPSKGSTYFGKKLFKLPKQQQKSQNASENVDCQQDLPSNQNICDIPQIRVRKHDCLASVGTYTLTIKDFKALYEYPYEVEDRVMDTYLQFLLNKTKTRYICYVSESQLISKCVIEEGDPEREKPAIIEWVKAEDESFNRIATAYNKQAYILHPLLVVNHWILLRILPLVKTCLFYNSLGTAFTKKLEAEIRKEALPCFQKFSGIVPSRNAWTIQHINVRQQTDDWSCGYFVLNNAENIMRLKDPYIFVDIIAKRNEIVRNLLSTTELGIKLLSTIEPEEDVENLINNILIVK